MPQLQLVSNVLGPDRLSPPCVLLEDRLSGAGGWLYARPHALIQCDDPLAIEHAFGQIERGLAEGQHAAGLLSYELGYALEPRLAPMMPEPRAAPLLWLGLFDPPVRIDAPALDDMFAAMGPPPPIRRTGGEERAAHMRKIGQALRLIETGDIYQVNLTFPIRFDYEGDPLRLYGALRARQPVAHGGLVLFNELAVLSVSPELWIDIADGRATARPMKGTGARGAGGEADWAARAALVADPKQRAENLMIVDLLRNDLARISEPGTVEVPALLTVETYPRFHTLTSTITSRLRGGVSLRDRIAAMFPCGSIVGAPKIRAAEVVRSLEGESRGVYTGAIGAVAPNGDAKFNVAIRTAVLNARGEGRYDVGGGIVADSDPAAEFDEAMLKARVLTDLSDDYGLIETFRWSPARRFIRLPLHLERLARSADELGFAFDREAAESRLRLRSASWTRRDSDRRVRLRLGRDGFLEIADQPLAPSKAELQVGVAALRLDPGDPFSRHKTTLRDHFEQAFAAAAARGLDEILFLNHRGAVAEASRNSVFVEVDGRLLTPPLAAGILKGVLRQHLLDSGQAAEANVTPDMLETCPLWLGNSLYGLRRALMSTTDTQAGRV